MGTGNIGMVSMGRFGDRFANAFAPLAVAVALLLLWQAAALLVHSSYLPPMTEILPVLAGLLRSGDLYPDLASTLARLFVGLGIGVALGIPLGLVSGRSPAVENFIAPILAAFYPVPKAALMPIVMLWFGAGDLSKVLIIVLTVSLPLIYHAQQGARTVDEKLIWSAQAVGCGSLRRLFRVILPAALPEILIGARVAIVIGVIVTITSEMIVRQSGLGNFLFTALDMGQFALTYAVILVIAALGFLLDWAFENLRRRLTSWAPDRREADIVQVT
jgi:NitT/TauT family transport system permease protein